MKKIITFLLLICLLTTVGTLTAFAEEQTIPPSYWIAETPDLAPEDVPGTFLGFMGDADHNNSVNVKDATAIQKHVAGIITLDELVLNFSDVDFSKDINVKDATAIQKWVAGIVPTEESFINHLCYEAYALDNRVFGKWECITDVGESINELLPLYLDDPTISEYITIRSCEVTETYEFFDDYSYLVSTDKNALDKALETIKEDMVIGMEKYIKAIIKDTGYDISVSDVLESMGFYSVEEYVEYLFPFDTILDSAEPVVGHYRTTPDGRIYLDEYSDVYYNSYTVEGDTLTLTGDSENLTPELYPLVFDKVN